MDVWAKLFNKGGVTGRISSSQCEAAAAVFGADDANVQKHCGRYLKSATVTLPMKQDNDVDLQALAQTIIALPEFQELVAGTVEQFDELATNFELLEGQLANLKAEIEQQEKMFDSRWSKAWQSNNNPAWLNGLQTIGKKDKPAPGASWTDSMDGITKHFGQMGYWKKT